MIHIYTGDGKGKTTAALGLALRAAGRGLKTEFLSFLKDGNSGEVSLCKSISGINVQCFQTTVKGFFPQMTEPEKIRLKKETQKGFLFAMQCAKDKCCDLLVLDEIAGCLKNRLLEEKDVTDFLRVYGKEIEIVLTGRDFPDAILNIADYISEINARKHPFDVGEKARIGIEF